LPAAVAPNEEVIATLEFTPQSAEFQNHVAVYVEDPAGVRTLTLTVNSASGGPPP
jgi:hypothetical protein